MENPEIAGQITSITKPTLPKTSERKFSFGFKGDKTTLTKIVKDLCDQFNFIDDSDTGIEDFISLTTTKSFTPSSFRINLDCQTTIFTYIIEKMEIYYTNFSAVNVGRSKCFYTKSKNELLTEINFNVSKSKRNIKPEKMNQIDNLFEKYKEIKVKEG